MAFLHAAWTADPTLRVCIEPPAIAAVGNSVSPSSKRIFSGARPRRSAESWVMIVARPIPISWPPLCTRAEPSIESRTRAD